MSSAAMITPQNAPRDSDALAQQSRAMRFRLALSCNMFAPDTPQEAAFIGLGAPEQAAELLAALNRWDMQNGNNGAPPHQAAPPMQSPPVGPPGMQQQQMQHQGPPPMQHHGPPPMQAQVGPPPMQAHAGPPPMQMQAGPPAMQTPPREPVTPSDPTNVGVTRPQPQQHQAPAQAPTQDPSVGHGAGVLLQAIKGIQDATMGMMGMVNTINHDTQMTGQQVAEIHQVMLGMARTQQSLAVLVFMVAEEQLGIGKPQLAKMVAAETQASLESLLAIASGGSGKG